MKSTNDNYELSRNSQDYTGDEKIFLETFFQLVQQQRSQDRKRHLILLNSCAKLLTTKQNILSAEEFFYCLSFNLTHQFTQIRAAFLRIIRYRLRTPSDLQTFNSLQLPYLVCRSLDIQLKNEEERIQALKLIRKIILISPELLSPVLVRCLTSLGDTSMVDGQKPDRIVRSCLATLSELGVLNPTQLIVCNGIGVITRNVNECDSPRISECLVGVLLHLLEFPNTREIAGIRLDCIASPYCDFSFRLGIMDKNKDARDLRFKCSRLALLTVLRSWTGTLEFCNPNRASGMKAIIDVLYLNQLDVRKAILDLMYELIGLPQTAWTDEYSVALAAVDPSEYQDTWRLCEGFVANEGRSVLPSLATKVPNICEIHQAFLIYCFIENGLLNALVEVIVSSDTFISVRATILLARLLQMINTMLPADICSTSPSLPTLVSKATEGNHQAKAAISALQTYHKMLRNRPAACSMYLDIIIQNGDLIKTRLFKREIDAQESFAKSASISLFERLGHDSNASSNEECYDCDTTIRDTSSFSGATASNASATNILRTKRSSIIRYKVLHLFEKFRENERYLRESMVLQNVDPNMWDWDIVVMMFRIKTLSTTTSRKKIDETTLRFIKTLTHYFKPTSNQFSHMELGLTRYIPSNVRAGIELIDYLLTNAAEEEELEFMRILTDFCTDISTQLLAIYKKKAHDCLFSPNHMNNTMCQQYFLFIGRLCRTKMGIDILKNTDILKHLMHLVANTNHTIYVKLIVSGLDYSLTSTVAYPRAILEKALTASPIYSSRLYATQFLLVLLRARLPAFEEWGIQLIMNQLKDKDRAIVLAALEIVEEACHENLYLLEIAHVWPELEKCSEYGKYIMMRFYTIPRGLNHPNANVTAEIDLWIHVYNKKYVLFVESETHSSLTLHTKNEDGLYGTRSHHSQQQRQVLNSTNLPCHLYGALVQTQRGINFLQKYGNIKELIEVMTESKCTNEEECLELKAALWGIGHVATNTDGIEFLNNVNTTIFEKVIRLTRFCQVYSIRATAFNVLCLISSVAAGANTLFKYDWISVRHDRNNEFPILEPEDWYLKNPSPIRNNTHDVPAYNYLTIDEHMLSKSSLNPLLHAEESSVGEKNDVIRTITDDIDSTTNSAQRSKTLPTGLASSFVNNSQQQQRTKHLRSLSESKTHDNIIGLTTTSTNNRSRFNSVDSNTSGVSSCDSVNMRTTINERFRRVSLTGIPIRDSVHMTDQDIHGYKKLRQIRRNLRPLLSESAVDDLADIFENDANGKVVSSIGTSSTASTSGTTRLFILDPKRKLHSRNVERQKIDLSGIDDIQKNIYVAKLLTQIDTKGPCYRGICLPRNILNLFPESPIYSSTYVSQHIQEIETLDPNLLVSSIVPAESYGAINANHTLPDESALSSISDLSTNNNRRLFKKKPNAFEVESTGVIEVACGHDKNECLLCCRQNIVKRLTGNTSESSNKDYTKSSTSDMNIGKIRDSDVSFYSPESIMSDDSANINMQDRIANTILRNVQKMANPIMFKACRKILMELKQKYPQSFQDICLYSEVCKYMSKCSYRIIVRRFIQEIFLDLNYDAFTNDIESVLGVVQQRLLNTPKLHCLPTTSALPTSIPLSGHKIHSMKSPLLASVHEASIENLIEYPQSLSLKKSSTVDEADGIVILKDHEQQQVISAEVHHSIVSQKLETFEPHRRRRFNTLELDLSCTKNKFPITHRHDSVSGPIGTSTLQRQYRPTSLNTNQKLAGSQKSLTKSMSHYTFNSSSHLLISPISPPLGPLFCEKRLHMQSYKSEATLHNPIKKSGGKSDNRDDNSGGQH